MIILAEEGTWWETSGRRISSNFNHRDLLSSTRCEMPELEEEVEESPGKGLDSSSVIEISDEENFLVQSSIKDYSPKPAAPIINMSSEAYDFQRERVQSLQMEHSKVNVVI